MEKKKWIGSLQGWSWIIAVSYIVTANIWHPFGLFGFVCMFTPIIIALSGRGKMHCARVCPRGSLLGVVNKKLSRRLPRPAFFGERRFKTAVWAVMMGSFAVILIIFIPKKDVYALGNAVLIFMETATVLALITGIIFSPRMWCTICPMGFTTENIKKFLEKIEAKKSEVKS